MENKIIQSLTRLFHAEIKNSQIAPKDAIADLLRISPEALGAFEKAYSKQVLTEKPEDFFSVNSRQASAERQDHFEESDIRHTISVSGLVGRIVAELIAQTDIYVYDGETAYSKRLKALPETCIPVENGDIARLPAHLRPQLSGNLVRVDINESAYPTLLWYYQKSRTEKDAKKRKAAYDRFRQGLDILDLDPVTYEIIGMNPNSMSHWLPALVSACKGKDFFRIPATTIAKVPLPLLQLTRLDYMQLTQTTLDVVDAWAREAFSLDVNKEYFIKTGTYSSKFDFRNAYVHGMKEVGELGEYLLFIHFQALQMASPLCTPCIYGASTTNEWVVREYIPDKEGNPCIYKGLPLHTEYRVFVDCDTDEVIGLSPYWEPNTMKKRFGHSSDSNNPHQIHDYVIYKAHEETLMRRYYENVNMIKEKIQKLLPDLDLSGQWSIDVMQNGDDFWIIDMGVAENSAFYECVPKHLRKPSTENWLPQLPTIFVTNE